MDTSCPLSVCTCTIQSLTYFTSYLNKRLLCITWRFNCTDVKVLYRFSHIYSIQITAQMFSSRTFLVTLLFLSNTYAQFNTLLTYSHNIVFALSWTAPCVCDYRLPKCKRLLQHQRATIVVYDRQLKFVTLSKHLTPI